MKRREHFIPPGGPRATARAVARARDARCVVLVEGLSDQLALEALAARRGLDLPSARITIVPVGGAHAAARFVDRFSRTRVVGLCDAGEEPVFRRAFARRSDIFYDVCVDDLEDELIRAHGAAAVEALLEEHRDLAPFRTFQRQPAWRDEPVEAQLRRFLGSADRRKLRYARILVGALDPSRAPRPLVRVLDYAASPGVTTPAS